MHRFLVKTVSSRKHQSADFESAPNIELSSSFWLHDKKLIHQWLKVLRFQPGQQVVLFDGQTVDRLYSIEAINSEEVHLKMVTELQRHLPLVHVTLFWSLLKKDNNDLILQKACELGVSNFVPIISERTIQRNLNLDRSQLILKEAVEQCGRSDLPSIREPLNLKTALKEYSDSTQLFACEQGKSSVLDLTSDEATAQGRYGALIGPEGGWSQAELKLLEDNAVQWLGLGDFTLRAETAAIVACSKFFNK